MQNKFKRVVNEYSKFYIVFGDEKLIHGILEQCNVTVDELRDLATYLAEEFERTSEEEDMEINDKIEQLQHAVNFILEARREGYKVRFKTRYIEFAG